LSGCNEPFPAEGKIFFFFALGGFWEDRLQEFVEMVFMDGETSRIFSNLILLRQWLMDRDQFFQSCLVAQIMVISIEDGYILKLWKPHLYMSCHCFLSPSHVRPVQALQV
jgi:hypothetical protein